MRHSPVSSQEEYLVWIKSSTKKFSAMTESFHSRGSLVAKTNMLPGKPSGHMEKCSFGGLGIFSPSILVYEVLIPIALARFGTLKSGRFLYNKGKRKASEADSITWGCKVSLQSYFNVILFSLKL